MPYFSLINSKNNKVVQIVDQPYKKFDVHPDYFWVDGPDSYTVGDDYHYNESLKKVVKTEYGPLSYTELRRANYDPYPDQLDQLWHDIDKGIIPGKGSSEWYLKIKAVKDANPKP